MDFNQKSPRIIYILIVMFLQTFTAKCKFRNATRTDLSRCKLTQLGTEFRGSISTTAGGIRCQSWSAEQPLHKISPSIKDDNFPERSMKAAKNYCRNPTNDKRGPWCYSLEPTLIDDECDVLLCNYGECRISGIGAEYAGTRKVSSSGRKCKSWDKRHKLIDGKTTKFSSKYFPDVSRTKADNYCRNPDDSTGGPWCYVETTDYEIVEKEYCDVPFCNDRDNLVYVRNASVYSTITGLNSTYGNITLWAKLWNPQDIQHAEARIILSQLPIPSSAKKIAEDWRAGVELVVSNSGSGQSYPTEDDRDFEDTPEILLGSKWTGLWITWGGGFISLGLHGSSKPLIMDEYKKKNSISSLYLDSFFFYGLLGTGVLWSTEFSEESCEAHTTFGLEFVRVWPIQKNNSTYDIHFYVRANRYIAVRLYQTPGTPFPCFTVVIGDNDVMMLIYQETAKSARQHLKEVPSKGMLNFWEWKEFTISIFGPHLRVLLQRIHGNEEILYVNHDLVSTFRWFSIGSQHTIAHWTLYCTPDVEHAVEAPWPPNCVSGPADFKYEGSQWTAIIELPCIPWISDEVQGKFINHTGQIPNEEKSGDKFVDGSALKALNKCRNPSNDVKGPYCYALSTPGALNSSKQYCPIRNCRSSECRMAGTANDYIGTLSTTRSGRTCAKWISDYDLELLMAANATTTTSATTVITSSTRRPFIKTRKRVQWNKNPNLMQFSGFRPRRPKPANVSASKPVHQVDRAYFNDSLYPEHSARNASNYCRDPSRNMAGTWCYTTDPLVAQDLCNVRDCEKPEECTFLVKGHSIGRRLYIMPEHRSDGLHFSLKAWEPDHPDSITFVFTADDGLKSRYILKIGAADNEKVLLYHESEYETINLVKKKTLPHLLYLGKWSSFVIRIPRGQVLVYYEGSPNALFEWKHPEPEKAFLPVYYYYNSENDHTIGVAFECSSRCQVEVTETDRYSRILPLSVWSKEEVPKPDRLVLMIRAKGVVTIPLFLFPKTPGFYAVSVGEKDNWIYFMKNTYPNVIVFHKQMSPKPIFTTRSWTNITLKWAERTIDVLCNETLVFHYEHHRPLLFYFFSLAVEAGSWATWSANCLPPNIDDAPLDGGWSEWGPWACSASCDGGVGTRKRICNSPEPNVRGEPCLGPSTMAGRCNTIRCGDITDDTVELIKRRIRSNHTALIVDQHDAVIIPSDPDIINIIRTESPDSGIQWSHNGVFASNESDRIKIANYDIVISKATVNDSGIYTITLHRVDDTYMILKIVTLAVLPYKESVTIRETLPMSVTCHCVILGYVYSDLKVSWMIKDEVWKDYGITLPIAVNVDHVPAVNKSHEGMWKCVVEQNDLGFKWTTNAILVKVLGPPNWRTHLMEDKVTRPIFGWMPSEEFVGIAALVIFLSLAACVIVGSIYYIRFRESLRIIAPPTKSGRRDPAGLQRKPLTETAIKENKKTLSFSQLHDDNSSAGREAKPTEINDHEKVEEVKDSEAEPDTPATVNLDASSKDQPGHEVNLLIGDAHGEEKKEVVEPQIDAIKIEAEKRKRRKDRRSSRRKARRVESDEESRSSRSSTEKMISKPSRRLSRRHRLNDREDLRYKMRRQEFFRKLKLYTDRGEVAQEKQEKRRLIVSSDTDE